jgi:hypothetical protein
MVSSRPLHFNVVLLFSPVKVTLRLLPSPHYSTRVTKSELCTVRQNSYIVTNA